MKFTKVGAPDPKVTLHYYDSIRHCTLCGKKNIRFLTPSQESLDKRVTCKACQKAFNAIPEKWRYRVLSALPE